MARLEAPVMNTRRCAPAAIASSTAYWISGLSTTGNISFGLALVAGRNRVPRPATGNTAFLILSMKLPPSSGLKGLESCRSVALARAAPAARHGPGASRGEASVSLRSERHLPTVRCIPTAHASRRPGLARGAYIVANREAGRAIEGHRWRDQRRARLQAYASLRKT